MASKRQLFLNHLAQTSDAPLMLEIERGEGIYLFDRKGKKHIDLIAGIGVSSLGHAHPKVVKAVQKQAGKFMHTLVYGEFVMSPQVELAKLISDNLPDPLDSIYFVNSGSEATEGAMKLAKRYTGRPEIISARYAYHGSTQGAASLMYPTDFTQAFHPLLPGINHINFNEENDLEKITSKTACVIVETVQAECGLQTPKKKYLKKLRKRCNETGTLLVLDEIQAGYGRTGTLWAFEQYGIVPDILLLAKGMGGGMPIAAFIASKEIMRTLSFNPFLGHITTFGGHPVCCAAGLATLKVLLKEDYISKVKEKEKLFKKLLIHSAIKEIRSAGLWMAVELESYDFLKRVINKCLEDGLITDWFLFNDKSLRIAPPLTITKKEIKVACKIILNALTYCQNK
ncbi:MAG: aspartate aminotransferase family protein [Bacteroidetes bacterium]|jgi:acetylornithine/succinyldiaminopimelate/putrescine aminotransferase|nr:aspartate aminotransferase family protein [Bacteroidota bacterium]MDF1863924.1 aspartate aminotransferase family protein [Saprospiraceae bacterium]